MKPFAFIAALVAIVTCPAADGPLRGAADYVPTPQNPASWRGDGSDRWPGAKPVVEWDEKTGKNILWKAPLKRLSCATPVAAGDKVFALVDPATIVCLSAADGKELWRDDAFTVVFPQVGKLDEATRTKVRTAVVDYLDAHHHMWFRRINFFKREDLKGLNPEMDAWLAALAAGEHPRFDRMLKAGEIIPDGHGFKGVGKPVDDRAKKFGGPLVFKDTPFLLQHEFAPATNGQRMYNHWTSLTFVPPVTDGERVYAQFVGPVVVAWDLDGKRLWTYRQPGRPNRKLGCSAFDPLILMDGRLVATHGGNFAILDPATGKPVAPPATSKDRFSSGINWVRMTVAGKTYALRANGDYWDIAGGKLVGNVKGEDLPTFSRGRVFENYDLIQRGDLMLAGCSGYGTKSPGIQAYRIVGEGASIKLENVYRSRWKGSKPRKGSDEKPVPASAWATPEAIKQHGGKTWKAGADWRGFVLGEKHAWLAGGGHWMTVADIDTGKAVDWHQADQRKCDNANLPAFADGKIFNTNWSGLTAVYDEATGKLIRTNQTEPLITTGLHFSGNRIYLRGMFHVYCIGAK